MQLRLLGTQHGGGTKPRFFQGPQFSECSARAGCNSRVTTSAVIAECGTRQASRVYRDMTVPEISQPVWNIQKECFVYRADFVD